jgi:outer membrane lipoprotein-sorting protein
MMRKNIAAVLVAAALLARHAGAAEDPKARAFDLLQKAEAAYENVSDYTATYVRQERVNNRVLPAETYLLKFKKPLKVYMKCVDAGTPRAGLEMIYYQGEYKNKVLLRAAGLPDMVLPTAELDPLSSKAMENSRYALTECGIGYLLDRFAHDVRAADLKGEIKVLYNGLRKFNGRPAHEVECVLIPMGDSDYYCYRSVVYFDEETKLPTCLFFYNWDGELLESYSFNDLRLNPGLTEGDFDPRNKEYNFGLIVLQAPREVRELPLQPVLPGCDTFARIQMSEPTKVFIFDGTKEREYYLGYAGNAPDPVAAAAEVELPSWPDKKTVLLGVRREGIKARITAVRVAESLKPEEIRFVEQFAGRLVADPFEPGRDVSLVMDDEKASAEWAAAIKAAAKRLDDLLSDDAAIELGSRAEREPLARKAFGR